MKTFKREITLFWWCITYDPKWDLFKAYTESGFTDNDAYNLTIKDYEE